MWWKDLVRRFLPVTAEHTNPFYGQFVGWHLLYGKETGKTYFYDIDQRWAVWARLDADHLIWEDATDCTIQQQPLRPFMALLTRREQRLATEEMKRELNERTKRELNARAVAAAITK